MWAFGELWQSPSLNDPSSFPAYFVTQRLCMYTSTTMTIQKKLWFKKLHFYIWFFKKSFFSQVSSLYSLLNFQSPGLVNLIKIYLLSCSLLFLCCFVGAPTFNATISRFYYANLYKNMIIWKLKVIICSLYKIDYTLLIVHNLNIIVHSEANYRYS